jgi:hypothetical protein
MKTALRFAPGPKFLAALLAFFFVVPPEAMASLSCATFAALSLPMRCCALHANGPDASSAARPCCCSTGLVRTPSSSIRGDATNATESGAPKSVRALASSPLSKSPRLSSSEGCTCTKSAGHDSAMTPVGAAGTSALASWIAERADISARAVHFEFLAPSLRLSVDPRGPPETMDLLAATSREPAAGCARHELLRRGIAGLLSDLGVALL